MTKKKTNGHHRISKHALVLRDLSTEETNLEINEANERLLHALESLKIRNAVDVLLSDKLLACIDKVKKTIEEPE